jgi:hypothetical protein
MSKPLLDLPTLGTETRHCIASSVGGGHPPQALNVVVRLASNTVYYEVKNGSSVETFDDCTAAIQIYNSLA